MIKVRANFYPAAALVAAMTGGCDGPEEARLARHEADQVAYRDGVENGVKLNSALLNGVGLNGFRTNGWTLNGWTLNGWTLNGWTLNGSAIAGTHYVDGAPVLLSGPELIGAEMVLTHGAEDFTLRFADIFVDPADPDGDRYFYKVLALDEASQTWYSLCRDNYGEPTEAIALRNHWDPDTGSRIDDPSAVTLACRGGALAKCVEWGYEPWKTAKSCSNGTCTQVSLADHHQACTRMTRADYCGTGTPYTLNGTAIDVFDRLSPKIQARMTASDYSWKLEAEWGPGGALCLGQSLRYDMLDDAGISVAVPPCLAKLKGLKDCGKFHYTRPAARLANSLCSKWLTDPGKCALGNDNDEDEDDDDEDDEGDDGDD